MDGYRIQNYLDFSSNTVTANAVSSKWSIKPLSSISEGVGDNNFRCCIIEWENSVDLTGVRISLLHAGAANIATGISVVNLYNKNDGQRAMAILNHNGSSYFDGIVTSFYFGMVQITWSAGSWVR